MGDVYDTGGYQHTPFPEISVISVPSFLQLGPRPLNHKENESLNYVLQCLLPSSMEESRGTSSDFECI